MWKPYRIVTFSHVKETGSKFHVWNLCAMYTLTGHQKVAGSIPVWGSEIVFLRTELDERSSLIHEIFVYETCISHMIWDIPLWKLVSHMKFSLHLWNWNSSHTCVNYYLHLWNCMRNFYKGFYLPRRLITWAILCLAIDIVEYETLVSIPI